LLGKKEKEREKERGEGRDLLRRRGQAAEKKEIIEAAQHCLIRRRADRKEKEKKGKEETYSLYPAGAADRGT